MPLVASRRACTITAAALRCPVDQRYLPSSSVRMIGTRVGYVHCECIGRKAEIAPSRASPSADARCFGVSLCNGNPAGPRRCRTTSAAQNGWSECSATGSISDGLPTRGSSGRFQTSVTVVVQRLLDEGGKLQLRNTCKSNACGRCRHSCAFSM